MKLLARIAWVYALINRFAGPVVLGAVLLFIRVVWGWGFFIAGKGKLLNIPQTIHNFTDWGIPAPGFHAYFIGSLECVGGLLLLVGLFSRPIAFLLAGNMTVALLTAHRNDVFPPLFNDTEPGPLFQAAPFWFLVTSLIVLAIGPGKASLDAIIGWVYTRWAKTSALQVEVHEPHLRSTVPAV